MSDEFEFNLEDFGPSGSKFEAMRNLYPEGGSPSELIYLAGIAKLEEYSRRIRMGDLSNKEISDILTDANNVNIKMHDDACASSTNMMRIADHDVYRQTIVRAGSIFLELTLAANSSERNLLSILMGGAKPTPDPKTLSFEERASNLVEKIAPKLSADYWGSSSFLDSKNVGTLIRNSEGGGYAFSTAYLVWEDKTGELQLKELVNTRDSTNHIDITSKLEETKDGFKIGLENTGSYGGEAWDKALSLDKKFMNLAGDDYSSLTLEEKLLGEGFSNLHANFISNELMDSLEVSSGSTVDVASKNAVYYLTDILGNKKAIKFYEDKKSADMQAAVNYFFSADEVLKQFVGGSDLRESIPFELDGKKLYAVVENDVRENALFNELDINLDSSNAKKQYFGNWMNKLATLHVRGTAIMNMIGNHDSSQSLMRDEEVERFDDLYDAESNEFLSDAHKITGELHLDFINQDLKLPNRIGQYIVDWGNAGRGNPYVDLAVVLNDPRTNLSEDEKQLYVSQYLKGRKSIAKGTIAQREFDLDVEMKKYSAAEFLVTSVLDAHYKSKNSKDLSIEDAITSNLVSVKRKVYQTKFKQISKMHPNGVEVVYMAA